MTYRPFFDTLLPLKDKQAFFYCVYQVSQDPRNYRARDAPNNRKEKNTCTSGMWSSISFFFIFNILFWLWDICHTSVGLSFTKGHPHSTGNGSPREIFTQERSVMSPHSRSEIQMGGATFLINSILPTNQFHHWKQFESVSASHHWFFFHSLTMSI